MLEEKNKLFSNLFSADLLVHIGNAEIESTLPTNSEVNVQLHQEIKQKETLLSDLKKKVEKNSQKLVLKKERIRQLSNEHALLQSEHKGIETQIVEHHQEVTSMNKEHTQIQKEREQVEENVKRLNEKIKNLQNELSKQSGYLQTTVSKEDQTTFYKEEIKKIG
uniref:A kinase anchor protein 9 n=1 Tax=Ditylenchus dipsaci TaxID=166011 RepID=A0A915EE45_9BILA